MKQEVLFVGNCHGAAIDRFLKTFTNFSENYTSKWYANWQLIENKQSPPIMDLARADIVVYQPLSDIHGCLSTNPANPNNMLKYCNTDCLTVSIPRIHNNSIWSIYKKQHHGNEFYGTECIDKYISKGVKTKKELINIYDSGQFDFCFEERFNKNKVISIEKEKDTDIKIFDYIESNIKTHKLFLTQDHPTTRIFYECVKQLQNTIDITFNENFDIELINDNVSDLPDSVYILDNKQYPVDNYMKNYFSFEWEITNIVDPFQFYKNNLIEYLKLRSDIHI